MRALLQRVTSASVTVEGTVVGQIKEGLVALVGIGKDDTSEDAEWILQRMLGAKLWENTAGKAWKAK